MLNYTKFFGQVDADKMIGKSGERVGYPRKHTMGFVVAKKSDERTGEKNLRKDADCCAWKLVAL